MTKKQFAVIGLGKFGLSVAAELSAAGGDVLAIDADSDRVDAAAKSVTCAVCADILEPADVERLGLSEIDCAVVAITGSIDASIMAVIAAREAGVRHIVAKARDDVHARILKKVGADRTVIPERESGVRIARSVMSGSLHDFIELSERVRLIETEPRPEWIGKTLRELDLGRKESISVVAIRRGEDITARTGPETVIPQDCSLFIIADRRDLARLLG